MRPAIRGFLCWSLLMPLAAVGAPAGEKPVAKERDTVAISVQGITDGSTEDNPGVLYILPWQPPTLPRRTREALDSSAPDLLEPVDPTVFERHRHFQHSMSPRSDS